MTVNTSEYTHLLLPH